MKELRKQERLRKKEEKRRDPKEEVSVAKKHSTRSLNSTNTTASEETMDVEAEREVEGDETECAFCYRVYDAEDGQDWVKCACSQWVHEEDIYVDGGGRERFCPLCLNT